MKYSSEILTYCNNLNSVSDLVTKIDSITEIVIYDVENIVRSEKLFFADFNFSYFLAVEILKKQLARTKLAGVNKFLNYENIEDGVYWIIQRLVNNMRNSLNSNYKDSYSPILVDFNNYSFSNSNTTNIIDDIYLERTEKRIIETNLKKLWNDHINQNDFTYDNLEYLCEKFEIPISSIISENEKRNTQLDIEQDKSGNYQLVLIF